MPEQDPAASAAPPAQPVTPPALQKPTAKEKKYDRQLRLWAAKGQRALEESHFLLLNSGSGVVGIETLKNLVLPGIGQFTIVDENIVTEEDLGINFFLEESSLGKSRAAECCRLLRELNTEVEGHWEQQSTEDLLEHGDLSKYSLILLIGPARHSTARKISGTAWTLDIPVFYVHSIGFYSHFSIQLPRLFPILDTHPDPTSAQDLRLLRPWPELMEHMKTATNSLDEMSDHDHGHVPYVLLLLHYLEEWKEAHEGRMPETYKEKTEFRDMVRAGARTSNSEGGEENFDEAVAAVLKSLNAPSIPSGFADTVVIAESRAPSKESPDFWIMSNSVHRFFCLYNNLFPLSGALPDMKAQSKDYIALQTLYRKKAQEDVNTVEKNVRRLEKRLERPSPIDVKDIEAFCKGAPFIKLIKGRKLLLSTPDKGKGKEKAEDDEGKEEEKKPDTSDEERRRLLEKKVVEENEAEDIPGIEPSLFGALMAFRAFDGAIDQDSSAPFPRPEDAKQELEATVSEEIAKPEGPTSTKEEQDSAKPRPTGPVLQRANDVAKELVRAGGAELHNVSALTGGMVAQEVIKVVTKQYVPADNTVVFDGVKSRTEVFRV